MLHVRRLLFASYSCAPVNLSSLVRQSPSIARRMRTGGTKVGDVASPSAASPPPRVKNFGCTELLKHGKTLLLICKDA